MDMEIVFPKGKKVNAVYKDFIIETDQSKNSGGEGSAPTPFDLFLASIGTCTGIYVLLFCQARHIPVERIKLILRTEKDKGTGMTSKINIEILLPPEFPEEYKNRIIRVAEQCSVKKHIQNPPLFNIYTKKIEK